MKKPTPRLLFCCEWDFRKVPPAFERACYEWEIEREAHGGLPPWLTLTPDKQRKTAVYFETLRTSSTWPVKELDASANLEALNRMYSDARDTIRVHALEIDWKAGREGVRAALDRWVDSAQPDVAVKAGSWDKGGNPGNFATGLLFLGALRLQTEGFQRPEASRLLGVTDSRKDNAQHWSNELAAIRKEIEKARARHRRPLDFLT